MRTFLDEVDKTLEIFHTGTVTESFFTTEVFASFFVICPTDAPILHPLSCHRTRLLRTPSSCHNHHRHSHLPKSSENAAKPPDQLFRYFTFARRGTPTLVGEQRIQNDRRSSCKGQGTRGWIRGGRGGERQKKVPIFREN